ncbi:MAG: hypothetical protein M0004_13700 [Actinomycetota bacterium]|nr:hypothetical protein [Actinomycetota bacterium]
MAELQVDGDTLVLRLARLEKLEAVHGDLRAPRAAVRAIAVLEDAHAPADRGLKVGERLPGRSEVATVHAQGERLFAAVHHDTPRGLRIDFQGTDYDAWIVGCADPEAVKAALESS